MVARGCQAGIRRWNKPYPYNFVVSAGSIRRFIVLLEARVLRLLDLNLPEAPRLPFSTGRRLTMEDTERNLSDMIGRVSDFGDGHAADFPAMSLGGQKFASIASIVDELN